MKRIWQSVIVSVILLSLLSMNVAAEELSIQASSSTGKAPLEVSFTASSSETDLLYAWDFNDDGAIDSNELSPTHTFTEAGTYLVKLTTTASDDSTATATTTISVTPQISVSITATPPSGMAPATIQFAAAATGKEPLSYAWDFNNDHTVDSTNQNPTMTFETAGEITVTLTVTDADDQIAQETISVVITQYESKLTLASFFPKTLSSKENQVTFLLKNEGKEIIKDVAAKVIGDGIQHLSSTTIPRLKPGEEDSLTVRINVLQGGTLQAKVKIDEKTFPVTFAVAGIVEVSPEELGSKLTLLKQQLQEQERIYHEKKAQNYLVSELYDGIKSVKEGLQDAQQQLLTNNLAGAAVALDLASSEIDDVSRDLLGAQKQKQTALVWLKENALAITTIIAAMGTISGLLVKASLKAKRIGVDVKEKAMKLGENVKERMGAKKGEQPIIEEKKEPTSNIVEKEN